MKRSDGKRSDLAELMIFWFPAPDRVEDDNINFSAPLRNFREWQTLFLLFPVKQCHPQPRCYSPSPAKMEYSPSLLPPLSCEGGTEGDRGLRFTFSLNPSPEEEGARRGFPSEGKRAGRYFPSGEGVRRCFPSRERARGHSSSRGREN